MREVVLNGRWPLTVPDARAARTVTHPDHEEARLVSMHDRLDGGYIIDCGAEQGDFAALFATWGCTVGLIEPLVEVWPTIRATWDANTTQPPVFSFPGFVSDRVLRPEVLHREGWPDCAFADTAPAEFPRLSERPDWPCVTIDYLTELFGAPDAITIDVEGAELGVLVGAAATLRHRRPLVWVSVHPELMARYGTHETDVQDFMREVGYEATHLADDHERHYFFEPKAH